MAKQVCHRRLSFFYADRVLFAIPILEQTITAMSGIALNERADARRCHLIETDIP